MNNSVVGVRESIEVAAQGVAGQENRTDTKVSMVNRGRNKVLIPFVRPGLAHLSNRGLIEAIARSALSRLGHEDFCVSVPITQRDVERYFIANHHMLCDGTGQKEFGSVCTSADSEVMLMLEAIYAFSARCVEY